MTRAALPFRKADVARAVSGAKAGGMEVGRIEIDPRNGKIVILSAASAPPAGSDLDKWLEEHPDARPA